MTSYVQLLGTVSMVRGRSRFAPDGGTGGLEFVPPGVLVAEGRYVLWVEERWVVRGV